MSDQRATLVLNSWAGRSEIPVKILGRTPKRVRVELLQEALMPGRKSGQVGDKFWVPTTAVIEGRP